VTVRPGDEWGTVAVPPPNIERVRDDAALGELLGTRRRVSIDAPTVALAQGDLLRAIGGGTDRLSDGGVVALLPCDALRLVVDDAEPVWAVAHVVVRHRRFGWWRGRVVAVMNSQYLGRWDVAPRAHPNDGRADVVTIAPTMSSRARWEARRRLPTGTHVPHPDISTRQTRSISIEVQRGEEVWIDGMRRRHAGRVEVTVVPDALTVVV
jgi:hypothetical protein